MRNAFIKKLHELAKKDERIVLLVGDLGYSVIEDFARDFPDRFYNVGIAEQNMIGIATGLANSGCIPFCYSIAPFTLLRPYEFIKNGPVLHNSKVRIIAVGGGFEYGDLGYTHYCLEDVAITRVFPNLRSYFPMNNENATSMLEATYDLNSPIYYRVGKNGKSSTDGIVSSFCADGIETINEKNDNKTAVITLSSIADQGQKALNENQSFNLYALTQINPVPIKKLCEIIAKHDKIITVEAHYKSGGIGSIAAEVIAEFGLKCKLIRLSVDRELDGFIGDQAFMENKYGVDKEAIIKALK